MAHREITDSFGIRWQVFEVRPTLLPPRPSATGGGERIRPAFLDGWLAFRSDTERRRVVPIPDRWDDLADEELVSLCARAERVGAPRRLIE